MTTTLHTSPSDEPRPSKTPLLVAAGAVVALFGLLLMLGGPPPEEWAQVPVTTTTAAPAPRAAPVARCDVTGYYLSCVAQDGSYTMAGLRVSPEALEHLCKVLPCVQSGAAGVAGNGNCDPACLAARGATTSTEAPR